MCNACNPASDDLERDVEAIVAACDGDMRSAMKTLLIANSFLEFKLERLAASASAEFSRRRFKKKIEGDRHAPSER